MASSNELRLFDFKDVTMQEAVNKGAALAMASETENVKLKISVVKDAIDGVSGGLANLQTQINAKASNADLATETQARIDNTIKSISTDFSQSPHSITVTKNNGNSISTTVEVASEDSDGLMPKESFNAIAALQTKVDSLTETAFVPLGILSIDNETFTAMSDTERTQQVEDDIGRSSFNLNNAVSTNDNFTWIVSSIDPVAWIQWGTSSVTVSQATNETLGIVQGDANTSGKVAVENDGTMSVVGWDELTEQVDANEINLASEVTERQGADASLQTQINNAVTLTGDQSISGVKTFSQSPIVPNPTQPNEVASKHYVDTWVNGGGTGTPPPNNIMDDVSPILFPMPFVSWNFTSREFGSHGSGADKWQGSVLAPNGKIYGIPSSSATVLEIDPSSGTSREFGSHGSGQYKWFGGVLAPNGKIYGIPYYSATVLEIVNMNNYPNFSIQRLIAMNQQFNGANL